MESGTGNETRLVVAQGDITTWDADAIVNAANTTLLGGGGVDGAIHRAAGPQLLEACRGLGGCATGNAKITPGFRLRARWVVHTVGPVWRGGKHGEDDLLRSCYRRSFEVADAHGVRSLAFPAISTGAYGFPVERAARLAVAESLAFLATHPDWRKVTLVCYSEGDRQVFDQVLRQALGDSRSR